MLSAFCLAFRGKIITKVAVELGESKSANISSSYLMKIIPRHLTNQS